MKQLVINMHIFLAPKANKDLSGGARQFGAEHIYRRDSPLIVRVWYTHQTYCSWLVSKPHQCHSLMLLQCNWIYCLFFLNNVDTSITNQENIYITMNRKTCAHWPYILKQLFRTLSLFIFQPLFPLPGCCTATVIVNKTHKSTQWKKKSRIVTETLCSWPMNRALCGSKISPQNANDTRLSLNMLNSFLQHYILAPAPQLQLGLTVCPDCQQDHTKTAKADISL